MTHIETLAARAGGEPDRNSGAVAPSIVPSTTFLRDADGSYPGGHVYSRMSNPNRDAWEECVAELEGGACGAAFASGLAACSAVMDALRPGERAVVSSDLYFGFRQQLLRIAGPRGVRIEFVDATDAAALGDAMASPAALLWIETPSNPLLRIADIPRAAHLAHQAGALLVCDNTWATPVLTRPFEHGADLVVHSASKYLAGHGDVIGGVVVAKRADGFITRVREIQVLGGAVPSPFDCWLALRGVRTLPLRVRAQCASAARIAAAIAGHPSVAIVHYPGLSTHPGHETAAAQMSAFGGMLSFEMRDGRDAALAVAAGLRLFTQATSLGGFESLVEHRASQEGPDSPTPQGLLRISVGLEHPDDLLADLLGTLDAQDG